MHILHAYSLHIFIWEEGNHCRKKPESFHPDLGTWAPKKHIFVLAVLIMLLDSESGSHWDWCCTNSGRKPLPQESWWSQIQENRESSETGKKKCSGKENIMVLYLLWSLKILARNKSRIKKEKSKQSTEWSRESRKRRQRQDQRKPEVKSADDQSTISWSQGSLSSANCNALTAKGFCVGCLRWLQLGSLQLTAAGLLSQKWMGFSLICH